MVGVFGTANAQQPFPRSPSFPTSKDCGNLHHNFHYNHYAPAYRQLSACYSRGPTFGYVTDCDGNTVYSAYVACAAENKALCAVKKASARELEICRSRVLEPSHESGTPIEAAADLINAADSAINLISSPSDFLTDAFASEPDALSVVFTRSNPHSSGQLNEAAGYQVYKFAHEFATFGTNSTSSSIIGAIQRESLERVSRELEKSLGQISSVSRQIESFGPPEINSAPPPPVSNSPTYQPESGACRILGTC